MNFSDYINKSTPLAHDLHESEDLHEGADKPSLVRIRALTLEQFEGALATACLLWGEDAYSKPLAMKVRRNGVNYVWYDEDEDYYCISDFTARDGSGGMPKEMGIATLAEAKRML